MGERLTLLAFAWAVLCPVRAAASPIQLPLKTWVARNLPQYGQGACPSGTCKHMRLAVNPENGRIYFEGGDYGSPGSSVESGRQETFSYSIAEDQWYLEYPFCTPSALQPSHPDEVTWAWDTSRHQFWMIPGYQWTPTSDCPSAVLGVTTFDPLARGWRVPSITTPPDAGTGSITFGTYDPITDTIIRFTECGCGAGVSVYDIARDTWNRYCLDCAAFPHGFAGEYSAIDVPGRAIYVIDPGTQVLVRYHIDSHAGESLGPLPDMAVRNQTHIAWDSTSQVLLWVNGGGCFDPIPPTHAWAFHPDTGQWEGLALTQPDGLSVSGNNLVYDPGQNALLLMGCPSGALTGKFFLYRYGEGPSGAPADSIPPSPPTNLKTR